MAVVDWLKKLALSILFLLLVSEIPFLLFSSSFEQLLSPTFLEAQLDSMGVYSNFHDSTIDMFSSQMGGSENMPLTKAEIASEFNAAISKNWTRAKINSLMGNLLSYLRSDSENLSLAIPISEIKPNITIAFQKLAEKMACRQLNSTAACEQLVSSPNFTAMVANATSQIPDTIDIASTLNPETLSQLQNVRENIRFYFVAKSFLLIAIVAEVLIGIAIAWHPKNILRWLGSTLFFSGIPTLLSALLVPALMPSLLASGFGAEGGAEAAQMAQAMKQTMFNFINALMQPMLVPSIALVAAGALLAIISLIMSLKERAIKK